MSADDNKYDDREDKARIVQEAREFEDSGEGDYSLGDDQAGDSAEVSDLEEIYDDSQEGGYGMGDDDAGGAEELDNEFEDDSQPQNRNIKKLLAPALVLVCAAAIGGYILMNPAIIGGGGANPPAQAPSPPPAMQQAETSPPPAPIQMPEIPAVPAPPDEDMPPQPVAVEQAESDGLLSPAPQTDAFSDPVEGDAAQDITEGIGAPPAAIPEKVIAGMPDDTQAQPAAPASPPAPTQAATPAPVEMQVAPLVFPKTQDISEEEAVRAAADEVPPPVESFPQVAPVAQEQEDRSSGMQLPHLEGGGAEEGVVGRGGDAADSQESLTPMEEKPQAKDSGSEAYFDSKLTIPTKQAAKDTGPRKVDPALEPGSRFVVVNKTYNSQSQESLLISANRALRLGRYEAAIEMFDSLYSRNPKDPVILMGRAIAHQKAGRTDAALKIYDEVLAVDKDNEGALLNMLGLLREQYPEVALRRLLNLHEQYPGNAGISAQIGLTQADMGHYEDALRYLGMAASIEPKNAQHLFNMAIVADRKKDRAQAIRFYEQALETDAVYGGGRSIPREQIYDRLSVLRRG